MILSVIIFAAGCLTATVAGLAVRRALADYPQQRLLLLGGPAMALLLAPLWIAGGIAEIGPVGVLLGLGISLLGWSFISLIIVWGVFSTGLVRRLSAETASKRPDIVARFREGRLTRWLFPK
jgi:hypothetical protein